MASSYSTSLGIEKMATGDQSGTWGTTSNHNWDIIDRISAYTAVALSDASTATLTVREASPESGTENLQNGMYRVIKFTGSLSQACTITIAPNTTKMFFIVVNATTDAASSGPYSLAFTQGSGANVTVQNGNNAVIFCDGAGGGAVVADALNDLQIGNDLSLVSDSAVLNMGADNDITITHVADVGLKLKQAGATGDGSPFVLTLQTGELDIAADDVLGQIDFQAPDEATGTDAILVAAGVSAISEGDFSSSSNATKLSFKTGASEAATEKMYITSTGNVNMKNTATGDDTPVTLTLQTGETDIAAADKLGVINFQAPDEGTGTDAILVAAGIEAVSEGDFSSSNNATKLSFKTAASEAATEKMHITSAGNVNMKNTATGDDTPVVLTLQTGETDIAASDKLGVINFQAPDEGTGTDAILVAAGIEAVSEGDFSSSSNATKLSFKTASSAAAAETASLSSAGLFNATGLGIDAQKMQSFLLMFQNRSGAINHQIVSDQGTYGASDYDDKITGASNSFNVTPSVDSSTAFTAGVGISATNAHQIFFDTAAMTDAKLFVMGRVEYNNTGNEYTSRMGTTSFNVNGTTRRRPDIQFLDFDGGTNVAINTTNIALNKILTVRVFILIP